MPTLPELVAAWASDALDGGATEAELVRMLRELEDAKTVAAAAQAEVSVAFDRAAGERRSQAAAASTGAATAADLPSSRRRRGAGVAGDVAVARRESPHAGLRHLGLAHALVEELPHALAAMKAGVLTERRAELAAGIIGCLSVEDRATADAELFADQSRMAAWGNQRVEAEARKVAYRLDPVAFTDRANRSREDRRVSLRPAPDTVSWLTALLPVAQGVAVHATLGRLADAARAGGSALSRSQLMADALVEKVTGLDLGVARRQQDPTSWGPTTSSGSGDGQDAAPETEGADEVPVTIDLVISDETLLRGGPDPAWLQGYGPLPAQTARDWVRRAQAQGRAALRRLYAAPQTGALVAMDSRARLFPAPLAHFIALRDATCRTPWCDAPIRQTDHIDPAAHGGPTSEHNGQGLCVRCNLDKEAAGWHSRATSDPPRSDVHTVDITTPAGQRVTSRAPDTPPPASQQPVRHRPAVLPEPGPEQEPDGERTVLTVDYCWPRWAA